MRSLRPALLMLVVLAAAAVGLGACSGGDEGARGPAGSTTIAPGAAPSTVPGAAPDTVPPTLPVPDGFIAPDTRGVYLKPVESKLKDKIDHTRPLLPVEGGRATLRGVVVGPDGPLEGATVRLERFVGPDWGYLDVGTNDEGRYEAKNVLGGRYRVRAWQKPSLASVESQTAFLREDGEAELGIAVDKHEGILLSGAADAAEPRVGQKIPFKTLVARAEVDDNGIVQAPGVPAAEVALISQGGVRIVGDTTLTTDEQGYATFTVMCTETGDHAVVISSSGEELSVGIPTCGEGEVAPDDTPPDLEPLAVGQTFTVPAAGPFPAGTYTSAGAGNCAQSYEEWMNETWVRKVSLDRTLTAANPIRGIDALPGSTPCTFRRTA